MLSPLLVNHNSCFSLAAIHSFISYVLGARDLLALEIKGPGLEMEKTIVRWDVSKCAWAQLCPTL